ncbi:MAG: Uma2 family endonuclease [Chloroflexi bacterium]|nr:Uma2 family endonuclease [Chloroflexota bacterium]
MTAEDLGQLEDNARRLELVHGELIDLPPTTLEHSHIALKIGAKILLFVEQHDLGTAGVGEPGFTLARNPDTVRAPDVVFVSKERLPKEPGRAFLELAPDLVVEVVSPSNSAPYIQAKVEDWLSAGVRLVWVVYPDTRSVVVYNSQREAKVLTAQETLQGDPVLPGFSCKVSELF